MQKMAPDLVNAVEVFQPDLVQQFLDAGWPMEFFLTNTGIALYSIVLGITEEQLNKTEQTQKQYI